LREARLRLDNRGVARHKRLVTTNTDLFLPLVAPVPADTLILARKMRWRLFYDYGSAPLERIEYRSAGAGFQLPFGGDLSAAGSLTLTQVTALAVLYSSVDGEISRKPSIIFDVTGEL
jgi:hypothetical protein